MERPTTPTVSKLILPVAGLGKRLRPLTLNCPKSLVSVNKRPLLEYVLHEALLSGIKDVILIISPQHKKQFNEYLNVARRTFPGMCFTVRVDE